MDHKPVAQSGEVARLVSYIALLAVSVGLFLEARAIPTSRFEVLGAGAFPVLVHVSLSLLLIGSIVGAVSKLPAAAYAQFVTDAVIWAKTRRLVIVLFACLAAYVLTMPIIGYPIATFLFLVVLQVTLAPKTRIAFGIALGLALVFSFGLNWLFAEVFNVFLPRGS